MCCGIQFPGVVDVPFRIVQGLFWVEMAQFLIPKHGVEERMIYLRLFVYAAFLPRLWASMLMHLTLSFAVRQFCNCGSVPQNPAFLVIFRQML